MCIRDSCDPRLVKLPAAEALVKKGHAHSAKLDTLMEMLVLSLIHI